MTRLKTEQPPPSQDAADDISPVLALAGRGSGFLTALWVWLIAIISSCANVANAASPPTPTPPVNLDGGPSIKTDSTSEVTIEAQRQALDHRVHVFVQEITHGTQFHDESIARWREPICFAVAGLPKREGIYVLERLPQIAAAAGARVAKRGCAYNFYAIFTPEPDQLLKILYARHRGIFDRSASPAQIRKFLSPSKPSIVRVWYNGIVYNKEGIAVSVKSTGGMGGDLKGFGIPLSPQYDASRLQLDNVVGLSLTMVVIDTTLVNGAKLGQLVDYVAMAGLAEINVDNDVADAPTILGLFSSSPENRPSRLTAWDQAFLNALYHTEQTSVVQRSQIAVGMVHEVLH